MRYRYRIYQEDLNIGLDVTVSKELSQEEIDSMGMAFVNGSEWHIGCGDTEEYKFKYELLPYRPERSWMDNLSYGDTLPLLPEDRGP